MNQEGTVGRELAPGDVGALVEALLDGIRRGELAASPREVDFLRSVSDLLSARERDRRSSSAGV